MAEASGQAVREPAVAGMFYPADPQACRTLAAKLVASTSTQQAAARQQPWIGGIVPHAGWICSGAIAGQTIATIASSFRAHHAPAPQIIVIFGAVHTAAPLDRAALDSYGRWLEPAGACEVRDEVRRRVLESSRSSELFRVDDRFHRYEHAIEVELPLVQSAWPEASILPVEVPLSERAVEIGRETAQRVIESGLGDSAVFLASSDLTHYGPSYRFTPAGVGLGGLEWAKSNDQRLLDRIERFEPDAIVPTVRQHSNACGGGAIAAMLASCRELGADRAAVLRHANSYQTLAPVAPQPADNAVGYASVVVGRLECAR